MKKGHVKSNISEDIKNYRVSTGCTQEELADLLGVDRKTIWEWETERKHPNKTSRAKISNILNKKGTLKGSTENHIDMKINEDPPPNEPIADDKAWFKKTIETLIQTKGEYINIHREVWDELKEDKRELNNARREYKEELKEVWDMFKSFRAEKITPNNRQG